MLGYDDVTQEALEIAQEFSTLRDLGDREQFLKAMVKVIPSQDYQRFSYALSSSLAPYGIKLVTVKYTRQIGLTRASIVESFIKDLNRLWPIKARLTFRRLRKGVLQTALSYYEVVQLLIDCINLTKDILRHPVIVLFHWDTIPFTLEALRFVQILKDLAKVTFFPWCITSSSPTLMLFIGEISYPSNYFFYDYRSKFSITPATEPTMYSGRVYDVDSKEQRAAGEILFFGTLADCDVRLNVWNMPVQFAVFEGNRAERIVLDFSALLSFQSFHQATVAPYRDQQEIKHLIVQWPDLNLEMDFGGDYSGDREVNVLMLVTQPERAKRKFGSFIAIPSRSVVRLQAIGSLGYKDLILVLP